MSVEENSRLRVENVSRLDDLSNAIADAWAQVKPSDPPEVRFVVDGVRKYFGVPAPTLTFFVPANKARAFAQKLANDQRVTGFTANF